MGISLCWVRVPSSAGGANLSRALAIGLALASAVPATTLASEPPTEKLSDKMTAAKSDLFSQQAGELHANSCAGLYTALGGAAAMGSSYAVRTQANSAAPNAHSVQGLVGMTYNLPNIKGQAAALVSAAPVGNKCEGQFVRVVPFRIGCNQILRDFPKGSTLIGNLSGVPLYQLGGSGGQALTITSGETCIVVSIVQGQQQL